MLDITAILKSISMSSIAIFFPVEVIWNSGPVRVPVIVYRAVAKWLSALLYRVPHIATLKGRECTHSPWWLLRELSFQ
jgi:hypothetical protein